ALLGLSSVALGQTTTLCDPLVKDTCAHDPAFGGDASFDFTTATSLKDLESFWEIDDGIKYKTEMVSFDKSGAHFTMNADSDAPRLISKNYLFFGKVEVTLQAAPGQGIITSIVLQSDDRDEIDWEFVGSHQSVAETNFYSKGVNDYTHSDRINVSYNPMTDIHTYTLDWTPDYLTFSIDGQVVRMATPKEANDGATWPQTPAQVRLGTWVGGGADMPDGTKTWAGGPVDWSKGPFSAIYKSIKLTDYGAGIQGATEYSYGDHSGTWKSIKVQGGKEGKLPDP
ncbi:cell wall glucanosyltransferase Mwg2, partial [Thozetella sp. PMI_491]